MKPFRIVVGGSELEKFSNASMTLERDAATASLSFDIFYEKTPSSPVNRELVKGAEIQVYVGGQLQFNGTVDKRNGGDAKNKAKHGAKGSESGSISADITKDSYTITIQARGKCKDLVDCSHTHKTGFLKNSTPKAAIESLTKPFGVEIDDQAKLKDKIDRVFYDGSSVIDEIHAILQFSGAYLFESPSGKLTIANHGESGSGDDLVLGKNILSFSASQTEEFERSQIKIKGNRTGGYGRDAITKPTKTLKIESMKRFRPYVGQIQGDATDERLKQSSKNEAAARAIASQTVEIKLLNCVQSNGNLYQLNATHYVEIPPEGIFDEFVVTEIIYTVSVSECMTALTLSPKAAANENQDNGDAVSPMSDAQALGNARRAASGISLTDGLYPALWSVFSAAFTNTGDLSLPTLPDIIKYPPMSLK